MIRVYYADAADLADPQLYRKYYEQTSPTRRQKADRMMQEEGKRLCIAAGAMIDEGLKEYGLSEKTILYGFSQYGKPCFSEHPELHFNLSHSKDKVMAVFADRPIGCDLEKIAAPDLRIADRFFCSSEREALRALPSDQAKELFFRIWTCKESYVKAVGEGMHIPLSSFEIRFSENGTPQLYQNQSRLDYALQEIELFSGYRSVVCVSGSVEGSEGPGAIERIPVRLY